MRDAALELSLLINISVTPKEAKGLTHVVREILHLHPPEAVSGSE